jgi:hypothetical protein
VTRRERLMATLSGRPVDRPAVNFYEIGGFRIDPSDPATFNVYNDPSWQPLLQLAEEYTDLIRMRSPVRPRSHEAEAARAPDDETRRAEFFKTQQYEQDGSRFHRVTLTVGGRTMTSLTRRDPGIDTIWTLKPLLKNTDDLKAYLRLPDEVFTETVNTATLIEADSQVADKGITMVDTEDPICAAASLFTMEEFTITALTEQSLFHNLLEKLSIHIHRRTEQTAAAFPGHLWRIYGPEYATEPYLPPKLFKEYVVRYTGPMVQTIHKHGGFARIHCHGRLRAVLDYIVGMGADAIDPVEPPPYGDMELADVRREYGRELVLFGNLELNDVENAEPDDFARLVSRTLRDGTRGRGRGFVLMPSSAPNGRKITSKTMANYETMVRLATQFNL